MQADWEIEIGADAPVIDADWPGFVDLHLHPERAARFEEAMRFPPLGTALVRLNLPGSPIRDPGTIDPDELDAPQETARSSIACYIDLLPREVGLWSELEDAVRWCKDRCAQLHGVPLRSSRVDLILRRAVVSGNLHALAVTSYLAACASAARETEMQLELVLGVFADCVAPVRSPDR
jgi:hypothetical protein